MITILPAAGWGTRISGKKGSKELTEVQEIPIISHALNASMRCDNLIVVVLRRGKEDIKEFIEDSMYRGFCSYVFQHQFSPDGTSPGFAQAVDAAYSKASDQDVLLGLPDTVFVPISAYNNVKQMFYNIRCDLLFGLVEFPHNSNSTVIMDELFYVKEIRDKSFGFFSWFSAAWNYKFTRFLRQEVSDGRFDFASICNNFISEGYVVKGFPRAADSFYDILDILEREDR